MFKMFSTNQNATVTFFKTKKQLRKRYPPPDSVFSPQLSYLNAFGGKSCVESHLILCMFVCLSIFQVSIHRQTERQTYNFDL